VTSCKHVFERGNSFAKRPPKTNHPLMRDLLKMVDSDPRPDIEICRDAGYSATAITAIRHAKHVPRVDKIVDIGQVLGYELRWVKT
jgi:hypothetical protein